MEKMSQELNMDNHDLRSIKKLYNSVLDSNLFLNEYTLLDVEESKKRLYLELMRKYENSNPNYIQKFIEDSSSLLINQLFDNSNNKNTQMVGIKNVIKDTRKLNQTFFNETFRIINIDSMYRETIWLNNFEYNSKTSTDMSIILNDSLDNVTSIELTNICIPFTFYNICEKTGNNYFYLQKNGDDTTLEKIEITSGNYNNTTIISSINTAIQESTNFASYDLSMNLNTLTNKVEIKNNESDSSFNFIFYDYLDENESFSNTFEDKLSPDIQSKINNNLGWLLGFRTIDHSAHSLEYSIDADSTINAESLCFLPHTKYFVFVIDDLNNNQTNKGMVQISTNDKPFIKKTNYFSEMDNSLNCLTSSNIDTYFDSDGRKLTKNQIYSTMQINNYRTTFNTKNSKMDANLINNVFAIVPFENKSLIWGESVFTSDKNKFKRKYSGPVTISRLDIKLLDDKGNILDLNGGEWSFSMMSSHLYQY